MFEYFKNIFIINLDIHIDRWKITKKQLDNYGAKNYQRFPGVIINNGLALQDRISGCTESHMRIIQMAKDSNWDNVLIFEDDINILSDKIENAIEFIKNNEWDLFYFGGNHNYTNPEFVSNNVKKITKTLTTHAYAANKNTYDKILLYRNKTTPIDVMYTHIQEEGKCYCISPRIITQRAGESYIWSSHRNYNKVLLGE